MYLRNSITLGVAVYMAFVLSGCGGSNDSKPTITNSSASSTSSTATSSSVASTASSTASSTPSSVASSSMSSAVASSATSSATSSAPVAIIQDTTLVLPSSLEVVTNEAAK